MKKPKKRFLSRFDGYKYGWFKSAREFVIALALVFLAFNLLVGITTVSGRSMEPTLQDGNVVFFYRVNFSYHRGDVVFARMPYGNFYVKRVVAVPGDVVDIRDGVLYVNDQPETDAHFQGQTHESDGIVQYPYLVEAGKYFLVGDNREVSQDSRSFGALPRRSIKGKLLFY